MFFSFGRKTNGYDGEQEDIEYYDDDGFYMESPYNMFNSTGLDVDRSFKIKSKFKQIKENSSKQQKK